MIENATVYINKTQIIKNTKLLRDSLKDQSKIIAVIKANGYGCDLVQSAQLCEAMDIDLLAVLSIDQALEIRKSGVKLPILLLGVTLESNFHLLLDYDIIQVAANYDYAKRLSDFALKNNSKIKVHIKVDTGLNRLGFKEYSEIKEAFTFSGLDILGIYSHFVSSQSYDQDDLEFSHLQITRFNSVLNQLREDGLDPKMTHLQNSPSILNFKDLGYSAVRCGMVLFGLFHPSQIEQSIEMGYQPVLELRARISMVKSIKKEEYVGYGRGFKAEEDMEIATISSGYVDGVMKNLSLNGGSVVYQDKLCPILGDIAMSQFMIDVSGMNAKVEDEVILFGHSLQSIYDYIALTKQTINELISHLRYSIPRIYHD